MRNGVGPGNVEPHVHHTRRWYSTPGQGRHGVESYRDGSDGLHPARAIHRGRAEAIVTEEQQLVASVIRERWPDEVDLVGDGVLLDLVRGRVGRRVTTGASADLAGVVALLLSASTLLKTIIEVIQLQREISREEPPVQKVEAELARRLPDPGPQYGVETSDLIEEMLERLPNRFR